jgi:hypothetical protein
VVEQIPPDRTLVLRWLQSVQNDRFEPREAQIQGGRIGLSFRDVIEHPETTDGEKNGQEKSKTPEDLASANIPVVNHYLLWAGCGGTRVPPPGMAFAVPAEPVAPAAPVARKDTSDSVDAGESEMGSTATGETGEKAGDTGRAP